MSDWSADYNKDYGAELDIFPCDSPTRLYVEYHEKHDLFTLKILHYPEHYPSDHSDWNHKETLVELNLCGRNLQAFMDFFRQNCQRQGFWACDTHSNEKECGAMRCAREVGHPGSHMTDEEWSTARAPVSLEGAIREANQI